ncbi:protoglobin domain-containing protein [Lentisphaera profundi]|uniref:Protoglobin domain-containing protein n=1 Tax=Lentisphaera profundi TaxID=1658616 RepID=A0ABY7W1B5_9BACT|nr:protoglobin domain-containing protein [Lentisphaera profundi]WDE98068.1 protoglobin domain-containing protein [Lentisphaera profundi]
MISKHSDTICNYKSQELLELFQISSEDIELIQAAGKDLADHLDDFIADFYVWLEKSQEFTIFFSDKQLLQQVKNMQRRYWQEFLLAKIDEDYVLSREKIGLTHARIGLSLSAYFVAVDHSLFLWIKRILASKCKQDLDAVCRAFTKMVHLDTMIVVEAFSFMTNKTISKQSQALMEMSTPVTEIWDDILMLPLVGIIDSKRSQDVMNSILSKIAQTQARICILDISGVAVVDTAVANHLIKISKATRLMGCECTFSGISPAIAQTIVELGIDVGSIRTNSNLKDALNHALTSQGIGIVKS